MKPSALFVAGVSAVGLPVLVAMYYDDPTRITNLEFGWNHVALIVGLSVVSTMFYRWLDNKYIVLRRKEWFHRK